MNRRDFFSSAILPMVFPEIKPKPEKLADDHNLPWTMLVSSQMNPRFMIMRDTEDYRPGLIDFQTWSEWETRFSSKERTCTGTLLEPRKCFYDIGNYLLSLPVIGEIEVKQMKSLDDCEGWEMFVIRKNKNTKNLATEKEINKQIKYHDWLIQEADQRQDQILLAL